MLYLQGGGIDLAAWSNEIRKLLLSPLALVNPIHQEQLEPFTEMDPTLLFASLHPFWIQNIPSTQSTAETLPPTTSRRCACFQEGE
jgi:hypothetical protein